MEEPVTCLPQPRTLLLQILAPPDGWSRTDISQVHGPSDITEIIPGVSGLPLGIASIALSIRSSATGLLSAGLWEEWPRAEDSIQLNKGVKPSGGGCTASSPEDGAAPHVLMETPPRGTCSTPNRRTENTFTRQDSADEETAATSPLPAATPRNRQVLHLAPLCTCSGGAHGAIEILHPHVQVTEASDKRRVWGLGEPLTLPSSRTEEGDRVGGPHTCVCFVSIPVGAAGTGGRGEHIWGRQPCTGGTGVLPSQRAEQGCSRHRRPRRVREVDRDTSHPTDAGNTTLGSADFGQTCGRGGTWLCFP